MVPDDDLAWREVMRDRIRSLRTAVALLGLLALAALAVAGYALLTQEEEVDAKRGASNQRVSALDDRVDKLESDVDDAPSKGSVSGVRSDQKALSERVDKLEARPKAKPQAQPQTDGPSAQDVQDVQSSVDDLGRDIEDLNGRVDELEKQAEASP